MTYCCAMLLEDGLVLVSDSRTNAGVDRVSTFRKTFIFARPGERVIALATAGNLSITQSVVSLLEEGLGGGTPDAPDLFAAGSLFEAARMVGDALRQVYDREGPALNQHGVKATAEALLAGQVKGEAPRLFRVYEAGNFIEATADTPYFQIGENKYGKPILDRVIAPGMTLGQAAKSALISFDSTMRSNISVGPPIDIFCYRRDSLTADPLVTLQEDDPYWTALRSAWGESLRQAFADLPGLDERLSDAARPSLREVGDS